MRLPLVLAWCALLPAADGDLPTAAQKAIDTGRAAIASAQAEFRKAARREHDKLAVALKAELRKAMQAENLDLANRIKEILVEVEAGTYLAADAPPPAADTPASVLGDEAPVAAAPAPAPRAAADPPAAGKRLRVAPTRIRIEAATGAVIGAVEKGQVLTLRYAEGSWAPDNHSTKYSPDGPLPIRPAQHRLILEIEPLSGPRIYIGAVPLGTAAKPFKVTMSASGSLQMHMGDDMREDNTGAAIYEYSLE